MFGDLIESALSSVGITKQRVERWLGGPCGCTERQQKLNSITSWAVRFTAAKKTADAERWLNELMEEQ